MVKLFGIYFALRRFDFITWNFVLMNCYMTVGIKEKERKVGEEF